MEEMKMKKEILKILIAIVVAVVALGAVAAFVNSRQEAHEYHTLSGEKYVVSNVHESAGGQTMYDVTVTHKDGTQEFIENYWVGKGMYIGTTTSGDVIFHTGSFSFKYTFNSETDGDLGSYNAALNLEN